MDRCQIVINQLKLFTWNEGFYNAMQFLAVENTQKFN